MECQYSVFALILFIMMSMVVGCTVALYYFRKIMSVKNKLIAQLKQEIAELRIEPLTRLMTRDTFVPRVEVLLNHDKRHDSHFEGLSVFFIDIDYFKAVNDTHGHLVGDEVLRQVSATIKSTLRETDLVCRWGGEEIVAVLPNACINEAKVVAEKVRRAVEDIKFDNLAVTVSIGVACTSQHMDLDTLLESADQAVYEAKQGGRNRVCYRTL